jgi:hypothetical protein
MSMTPDETLRAFLAATTPSARETARDYVFEAEVARRIALRRAWLTAAALVPWAAVGTVLLWALIRAVGPLFRTSATVLEPTVMAATLAGAGIAAILWLSGRVREA